MSGDIKSMLKEEIEQYLNACGLFETLNMFRRELENKSIEDNDEVLPRKKKKSSIAKRYFESEAEKKLLQSKICSARKKLATFAKKLLNLDLKLKGVVDIRSKLIKRNMQLLDELEAKIKCPYFSDDEESCIASNFENVVLNSPASSTSLVENELLGFHFNKYESKEEKSYDLLNFVVDHNIKCSTSYAESSNSSLFSDFPIIPDEELKNIYPLSSAISLSSDKTFLREKHHSRKISEKTDLMNCAGEISSCCNKNVNNFGADLEKNCTHVPERFYSHETVLRKNISPPCIYTDSCRRKHSNDIFSKNEEVNLKNCCYFFENDSDKVSRFSGMRFVSNSTFSPDMTFNKKFSAGNSKSCREKISFVNTANDTSSYNNYCISPNLPYRPTEFHTNPPNFLDEISASRHEMRNKRKISGKYLENSNGKSTSDPCQKFDARSDENCRYVWKDPTSFDYGVKFNITNKQDCEISRNLNNESVLNAYQKTNASYGHQERKSHKQYLFEDEKMFDKMDCNAPMELKTPFWRDKVKEYQNNISVNDQEQVRNSGDLGFTRTIQSKSRPKMLQEKGTDYFSRCKRDTLPGSDSFFDKDNDVASQWAESKHSDDISFSDIQIISDEELRNIYPLSSLISLASTETNFCKNRRKISRSTSLERKIKSSHSRETIARQEKIEDIRMALSEIYLTESNTVCSHEVFQSRCVKTEFL